jgi:tripartite-type tricarboxylate transporter receptor subunit TctC
MADNIARAKKKSMPLSYPPPIVIRNMPGGQGSQPFGETSVLPILPK